MYLEIGEINVLLALLPKPFLTRIHNLDCSLVWFRAVSNKAERHSRGKALAAGDYQAKESHERWSTRSRIPPELSIFRLERWYMQDAICYVNLFKIYLN